MEKNKDLERTLQFSLDKELLKTLLGSGNPTDDKTEIKIDRSDINDRFGQDNIDSDDAENITIIEKYWKDYEVQPKRWGKGGYGRIYKISNKEIGIMEKVIKVVEIRSRSGRELKELKKQYYYSNSAVSNHVVQIHNYHKICTNKQKLFIEMSFMEGSIKDMIERRHKFSSVEVVRIACDILEVLKLMEKRGDYHRDIKPANILYDKDQIYKLSDFGCIRNTEKDSSTLKWEGTEGYAPIMDDDPLNSTVDIYALGISMIEMLNLRLPSWNERYDINNLSIICEKDLCDILKKLCSSKMKDRYQSANELYGQLKEWLRNHQDEVYLEDGTAEELCKSGKDLLKVPMNESNYRMIQRFFMRAAEKGVDEAYYELAVLYYTYPEYQKIALEYDYIINKDSNDNKKESYVFKSENETNKDIEWETDERSVDVSENEWDNRFPQSSNKKAKNIQELIFDKLNMVSSYYAPAQNMLAMLCLKKYFPEDLIEKEKIGELVKGAADAGYAPAQYNMAMLLSVGLCVQKDEKLSKQYMEQAKKQSYPPAMDFE